MKLLNQSVQWHITEVCPNRCKHCYIDGNTNYERRKNELNMDGLITILQNLDEFERKFDVSIGTYVLTGGDPFEHADFEKLLSEIYLRGKIIKILGIPERISKETLMLLDRYNVDTYQVSLDGMKNTHDMIRGKGSFDRTIDAIRLMNELSNVHPHIMYTLHKQNCNEMFELIHYLGNSNLSVSFSFDFLVLEGQARKNFSMVNKEEVDEILIQYRKERLRLKEENSKLILREKVKLFETFDIEGANDKFKKYSYISGCMCGIASVAILPNGDLLPCRRLPITIGNLLEDSYSELFLNNVLMRKLRRISSYKMCGDCDYGKVCRGCPAVAYSVTGDPFDEMIYCNRKKKVEASLCEPPIDCTEKEEFAFVTNNLISSIQREGALANMSALKHDIYKRRLL